MDIITDFKMPMVHRTDRTSSGIMDLANFEVNDNIAGWALNYLFNRPEDIRYEERGDEGWYIGWGGRIVIRGTDGYRLKGFRRFEYRILDEHREEDIDALAMTTKALRQAKANTGKEYSNG